MLADLVEATVDLHGTLLAQALGLTGDWPILTRDTGLEITGILRKDPPAQHPRPFPTPTQAPD
ncbi:hypothetical protein [Streptomyces sp. NBC_00370]|uniref:hypothetical protein n=1 Tax=Streptomyces sp. NBC_00370 TaxID=2975728 RepID=UPI002E25FE24